MLRTVIFVRCPLIHPVRIPKSEFIEHLAGMMSIFSNFDVSNASHPMADGSRQSLAATLRANLERTSKFTLSTVHSVSVLVAPASPWMASSHVGLEMVPI